MNNDVDFFATEEESFEQSEVTVGGYSVPVDPMDLLNCDSCQ